METLVDVIIRMASSSEHSSKYRSDHILTLYRSINELDKAIIDNFMKELCGYPLNVLIDNVNEDNKGFVSYGLHEFNAMYGTYLKSGMTFHEAISELEEKGLDYYYCSLDPGDVIEAIEEEKEFTDKLNLDRIFISGLDIYLTLIIHL
jgi:hypothetical protein